MPAHRGVSTRYPRALRTSTRSRALEGQTSNNLLPGGSNREAPGIARMHVIDDIELDTVRIDILALILLLGRRCDFAVLHLAAVRKTLRDVFGLVRVNCAAFFRPACGLIDVVGDKTKVMQTTVAERLLALLVIEDREAD